MAVQHLKTASKTAATGAGDVRATVQSILDDIENGGDDAARRYAAQFDKYDGEILLSRAAIDAAADRGLQAYRRLFAAAAGRRRASCDRLHRRHLRGG